ncbi:hypothetical protein ACH5RR_016975 [Cinchona calisaya]|uniref:Protein kinase domain-containing protein n=1 Tax=Cinchona calisaya TaxID=153742 RepID=A0ABD2ZZJ8_9GENT
MFFYIGTTLFESIIRLENFDFFSLSNCLTCIQIFAQVQKFLLKWIEWQRLHIFVQSQFSRDTFDRADGYPVGIGNPNPCDNVRGANPTMLGGKSNRKDEFFEKKNRQFTYSDLVKITNNFQSVLGKGGFGTVYHGLLTNGKQVAIKLLSHSSVQGYIEFQTETVLLTRVHHRNLTSLVGYCHEDTNMALVYEVRANGNLREHLSVTDDKNNTLNWLERLQITLDAA